MAPSKAGQFRVTSDVPNTVSVAGTLTFATAAGALAAMRSALGGRGERLTLDLAGVDTCDSAGLACVLAALSEADQGGRMVTVQHVPAGMQALARVCGVDTLLH